MGEMIKTTEKICKSCKYSVYVSGLIACDDIGKTYKSRKCELGYCDKYESKKKK